MHVLRKKSVLIPLILLILLAGAFVFADRMAVGMAEDEVASRVRDEFGLAREPEVSIAGFPFLTQVMRNRLDEVSIGLDGYEAQVDGQSVTVNDMQLDVLGTELGEGYSSATAESAAGTGVIGYEELTDAYGELMNLGGVTGFAVEFGYAGDGQVLLTLQASVLGQSMDVGEAVGDIVLEGDTVRLEVPDDEIPSVAGERMHDRIQEQLSTERPISDLPQGLELTSVTPAEDGLALEVSGSNVKLA